MFTLFLLHMQNFIHMHVFLHLMPVFPSNQLSARAQCPVDTTGLTDINTSIENLVKALAGIGGAVCALGLVVGGIMRATSFGNERRVSDSNTAITCAVVGLLIVLLSWSLGSWLNSQVISC
jgi:hypothetical protein